MPAFRGVLVDKKNEPAVNSLVFLVRTTGKCYAGYMKNEVLA
jgi:hypothetical protein